MTSTGFDPTPSWHWPDNAGTPPVYPTKAGQNGSAMPGSFQEEPTPIPETCHQSNPPPQSNMPPPQNSMPPRQPPRKLRTHWPPRTCRICLETVNPTFHPPSDTVPNLFQPSPFVTYDSTDPDSGRLLRPCKCKGSSKYVHEGCLQSWRHADPGYARRNYWQCPTCGFQYRLERMRWGRWISCTATQIVLTIFIFFAALFVMGFVADPIINLYVDLLSVISTNPLAQVGRKIEPIFTDNEKVTWMEHFVKGLASLGLLGFVKVIFALSPWQWWNLRTSGIMNSGGRSGNTGRDRLASISWIVVLIGIGTFLWAVYKGVRAWSRRTLEKAGERVMDVAGDDNDDDEDE